MDIEQIRQHLIETAHDGMFYSDAEGRVRWSNQRMAAMLGYESPKDVEGVMARDLYVTPRVRDWLQRQLEEQGKVTEFVAHLKRQDGSRVIIEANVSLLTDDDGKPAGLLGVARDITRRVRDEDRQQEEREFNELILNTVPTAVLFVNTEGTIRWANAAAYQLCRCRPSQLLSRNIFSEGPEWLAQRSELIRDVLHRGKIVKTRREEVQLGPRRKAQLTFSVAPTRQMGEIAGALVEIVDVSETVQMYEEMLAAERKFRSLFDQAPEIYFSVDSQGLVVDCNETACQVLGFARDDLIGRQAEDLYDARSRRRAGDVYAKGKVVSVDRPVKLVLVTNAGDSVPVTMVTSVVHDDAGRVITAFAVHRLVDEAPSKTAKATAKKRPTRKRS